MQSINKRVNPAKTTLILVAFLHILNSGAQELIIPGYPSADTTLKRELLGMSLEELMSLEIEIGTIIPSTISNLPVSATIIDKSAIQNTPARNILDLIEVYVPGATYVNHWKGPRLGIRGVLGDQNTSYLLLVNGENMNIKTSTGPFYEIQNRDLNDIQQIEIISGPGSVTYGHGAIGGIINISTLSKEIDQEYKAGLGINTLYRYGNIFTRGGITKNGLSVSWYGSINASLGEKNPMFFYVDRAHGYGYGFMGWNWGNKNLGTPAPPFYGDLWNKPQVKLQLNMKYRKDLQFWMRYSDISFIKQQQKGHTGDGYEFPGLNGNLFMSVFQYDPEFSDNARLSARVGFTSNSNREVYFYQGENAPRNDITQMNYSFSENEVFTRATFNIKISDNFKVAAGGDFRYLFLGPEWGMEKKDFFNSFPPPLRFAVYDTTNSGFYQEYGRLGIVSYIDETIDAFQYSGFAEAELRLLPSVYVLLSGRLDKHEFSNFAFSPRMALIGKLNNEQTIKLIGQKAMRLPTFNELYTFNRFSEDVVDPEVKQGFELMYNNRIQRSWYLELTGYYNSIEQIAWIFDGYPDKVGKFDVIGAEAGIKYQSGKNSGGINYSFVKQIKWDPVKKMKAFLNNIGEDSLAIPFMDYGENRLNNLPGHSLKFYYNYPIRDNIQLHVNGRVLWGFGQIDMLNNFKHIHDLYGSEETKEEMSNIYKTLRNFGYAKPSFTSNISISVKPDFLPGSNISLSAMNILRINHIRYVYQFWENGNNRQYPRHIGFIQEPVSIELKWMYNF